MHHFPIDIVAQARVLVVGDIILDRYWFGEVERISPEAPIPIVRVTQSEDRLGGAANVARNVAALGAQATLIGLVGHDEGGNTIRRIASEAGINTDLVMPAEYSTTLKMRVLGRQQQLIRVDFERLPEADVLDKIEIAVLRQLKQHDILILSDYAKGVLIQVVKLIAHARAMNIPVLVDPKGDHYAKYHGATLVTPNRLEMQQVVGCWSTEDELTERAQNLRRELNLEALLVTRSHQGMTLFTEIGRQHVNAQTHEVFDVSGAGDTVLATLGALRCVGLTWSQAMYWANHAGGIAVGKLGTSVVTAKELLETTS